MKNKTTLNSKTVGSSIELPNQIRRKMDTFLVKNYILNVHTNERYYVDFNYVTVTRNIAYQLIDAVLRCNGFGILIRHVESGRFRSINPPIIPVPDLKRGELTEKILNDLLFFNPYRF